MSLTVSRRTTHVVNSCDRSGEFRELLSRLGVELRHDGQHTVRCWRHEDRTPSLSVNPRTAVWYCHSCARGGGVVELLDELGLEPAETGHITTRVVLERFARMIVPGVDLVAVIPPEVVDELRRRTDGHRRAAVLSSNLARVLASIWRRATEAQHHTRVRFTVSDAAADGISARLWHELVGLRLTVNGRTDPIVSWLGVTVRVGECGRRCGPGFTGTGDGGSFRATEVDLSTNLEHPKPLEERTKSAENRYTEGCSRFARRTGPGVILAASVASSRSRGSVPSLARRRAVALLLADLAMTEVQTMPNRWTTTQMRTVHELVATYGERIRRTIRDAEMFGWVSVARLGRSGLVHLTDAGLERLESDHLAGSARLSAQVAHRAAAWADKRRQLAESIAAAARRRALNNIGGELTPFDPVDDGRLVHTETGELVTVPELRSRARK